MMSKEIRIHARICYVEIIMARDVFCRILRFVQRQLNKGFMIKRALELDNIRIHYLNFDCVKAWI
jgi:hypothetical protein